MISYAYINSHGDAIIPLDDRTMVYRITHCGMPNEVSPIEEYTPGSHFFAKLWNKMRAKTETRPMHFHTFSEGAFDTYVKKIMKNKIFTRIEIDDAWPFLKVRKELEIDHLVYNNFLHIFEFDLNQTPANHTSIDVTAAAIWEGILDHPGYAEEIHQKIITAIRNWGVVKENGTASYRKGRKSGNPFEQNARLEVDGKKYPLLASLMDEIFDIWEVPRSSKAA